MLPIRYTGSVTRAKIISNVRKLSRERLGSEANRVLYLVGQEVASEEGAHVEEGLGADQAGGQVEGQVVAQVGGLVVEVEVKAHADLVNQEVSGKEELLKAYIQEKSKLVHG